MATSSNLSIAIAISRLTNRLVCITCRDFINLSFPHTNPTIIMAILSADLHYVLVDQKKRWDENVYSNLTCFVEPDKSIKEAICREA